MIGGGRRQLLRWYRRYGRRSLPWRTVRTPYRTLVSEFMLAQTQVERVVPKFEAFMNRFPDLGALARATRADVLRAWKGLGYNSRAVRLHELARAVLERHAGTIPSDAASLRALPGIGPYTAAAIRAFGFDADDAPVDTNVRRVVHRLLFGLEYPGPAPAAELERRARELLPRGRAHDWNSAVMDLGAAICTARAPRCSICPLRRACAAAPVDAVELERLRGAGRTTAAPQGRIAFRQSTRYARGRIVDRLRDLPPGRQISLLDLHRELAESLPDRSIAELRAFVEALDRDGLVAHDGTHVALRE